MSPIFAIVICMSYVNPPQSAGCQFPENGMTYFQTAEECKKIADLSNQGSPYHPGDTTRREVKCVSKSINTWKVEE